MTASDSTICGGLHCSKRAHVCALVQLRRSWSSSPTDSHIDGSRPLIPAFYLKLDALAFLESVEVELLKAAAMEEDFFSILGLDEPEPSVVDELLNCSLHVVSIVVVWGLRRNDWERLGGWFAAGNPLFASNQTVPSAEWVCQKPLIYISSVVSQFGFGTDPSCDTLAAKRACHD